MRRQRSGRRRGFTLTELMVVVLLMGLAIAIFSASFPAAGQSLYRSRHIDLAANACNQQLEFWRNVGYSSVPPIPAGTSRLQQSFDPPAELPGATGTVVFTRLDGNYAETTQNTGRLRVDVSVSWAGSGNDRGTVSVTTLLVE
jgi:prepilin-type N-terminal cleavage/methylation domain-containing protein